jgi:predicted aspartyl protease
MTHLIRSTTTSALLLSLIAFLPAAAADDSFELPFTIGPRGHLIIDVSLNGKTPIPFLLDTGAGRTVLNRARLDSLGLTERPSGDTVQGAHDTFTMGLTDVASLALGETALHSLELAIMDLSHTESPDMAVYGVLGYDLFGQWDLEIDLGGEQVAFHRRAESELACAVCSGDEVVPFELNNGTHIQLEIVISEQSIAAILDTGSGRTGMNHLAAKAIGIDLPPSKPGAHGPALQVGALHLGDAVLARDVIVGVVDLPVFEQLGLSDEPAMLVGTGALDGKRIGIAYGLELFSLSTSP